MSATKQPPSGTLAQDVVSGPQRSDWLLGWFRELPPAERRTFWACFMGWALDSMDAQLYSFVIPTLIALWGMSRTEAGLIATSTLLASSLGGWLAGFLADRVGRVRMLQITILWFAIFTCLGGLTNGFWQLLAVRTVQGFGFGGEWSVGAVLIAEIMQPKHRGKGNGTVHSGWAVGWGAAALAYMAIFSLLPSAIAWRCMFAIGLLPALLVLGLRRWVTEPDVYKRDQARQQSEANPFEIFAPGMLRTTILASLLAMGCQGGFYAIVVWLPTYLKTVRGLSVLNTGGFLMVVIVASFLGYVTSAYMADFIGRRKSFFLFSGGSVLTLAVYMFAPLPNAVILFAGIPLGFFSSGIYSPIGAFFNELYPTRIRGSGIGFCFNFGRAFGAAVPALVGVLSATVGLGQAIGVFATGAYAFIVIAALLLPETNGMSFES